LLFANGDSPPDLPDKKKVGAELIKSARNPPEIGNPSEIFFARQTNYKIKIIILTFKSARIVQIWQRKSPSDNAKKTELANLACKKVIWQRCWNGRSSGGSIREL
jgi:hypothetical protein